MPQPGNDVAPAEGVTYVGIDTLQEQTRIKALRRGYSFNLIVVGEFIFFIYRRFMDGEGRTLI